MNEKTMKEIKEKAAVNWDALAGRWKELRGKAKEKWSKLTDDELGQIAGKRDRLEGAIQKQYGLAKEEARQQVEAFARECKC